MSIKISKQEIIHDCTSGFEAWLRFKTKGDKDTTISANGKRVLLKTDYGYKELRG